jgi:hypothetical protein
VSHETITTEEMLRDIAETEHEIATMEREIQGFRLLGDRWSQMRADARVERIRQRREFIEKVNVLLSGRGEESDAD